MEATTQKSSLRLAIPLWHRLAGFWSWWTTELGGMLPRGLRNTLLPAVEQLMLQLHDNELIASQGAREHHHEVARLPIANWKPQSRQARAFAELAGRTREVVLCLPAEKTLVKTLTLPLATKENLREVLGFEIDRQTPFTTEQVYYDHALHADQATSDRITLDLLVTPRPYLDEQLRQLGDMGLQVDQVTRCSDETGQPLPANLLPAEHRPRRTDATRYLNLALAVVAVVLLLGTVALPLVNKLQVIRALEARVELANGKAEVTRRLREEVERLETVTRFLVEKKRTSPLVLGVINELTEILPDDTWLRRLDIKAQEVNIQGESRAAATLIPIIEASGNLHNPRFRSPVTKAGKTNIERFHLSAELSGESGT